MENSFSDNSLVPFTYYPSVSASQPQLISLISKNTNVDPSISTCKLDINRRGTSLPYFRYFMRL